GPPGVIRNLLPGLAARTTGDIDYRTKGTVMAMAEKFNTGQEVCLQIPSARGVMQVKEGTSGVMRVPRPLSAFKAKQSSRCKARSPSRPKSRSRWGQFGHWSRQHR